MGLTITLKLVLSLVLGAVIGLERESYEKEINPESKSVIGGLGVRTFALVTSLGAVAGLLRASNFSLFLTLNITFMLLLLAYYVMGSILLKDNGITTELAVIFAYLIGLFVALEIFPIQLVFAMTVILILILSRKEKIKNIVSGIKKTEINAFISYALIALVVLPFLPKQAFFLTDIPGLVNIFQSYGIDLGKLASIEILNPFKLWLVVALITGVDMFGYFLEKTIGQKKGWLLTSIAGGFISSTATIQSLAQQSKKSLNVNRLVAASIFANLASFFQIFILIASLNSQFLVKSTLIMFSIIMVSFLSGLFFLKLKEPKNEEEFKQTKQTLKEDKIFALNPALKFAGLFLLIKFGTKIALVFFGDHGFLAASALGAVTGIDAVTINLSELAGQTISLKTAALSLIVVNAVNLLSKTVYSFVQGKKEFALKLSLSSLLIVLASFLGLLAF
ncbi:hypothetical protein COT75_04375 [Candidatus Beckwithbacteria bacterium CG10_big_fil_rev_8_21_14_0_10_34_10]|uniref:Uncharacterized protein n=1 Tax=Candidatus Beckwithbacteria bacterium CG10_big_fil_rev_8_21_14_0_10_34_10 TaxID=1974495 RepID=A0A2H0W894_9BACT|nr:MAG: hypothetical protein COT75_04375 [Candidatus Beckwithbacteria bacterium CG10_big_fil_rev_8_21_14_0_10_34_10]